MGCLMAQNVDESEALLVKARAGDEKAKAELFARHQGRLKAMVRLRMDRRLSARIDASDVLQEAYVDFVWLRGLTGQRLIDLHRQHLGAQRRDAGQEISLYRGALPQASSVCLANQLLGLLTSPTQAAVRAETQIRLQEILNTLDPLDREVLALRHFEELTNGEAAEVLHLDKSAASKRYIRALRRLKEIVTGLPGFGA